MMQNYISSYWSPIILAKFKVVLLAFTGTVLLGGNSLWADQFAHDVTREASQSSNSEYLSSSRKKTKRGSTMQTTFKISKGQETLCPQSPNLKIMTFNPEDFEVHKKYSLKSNLSNHAVVKSEDIFLDIEKIKKITTLINFKRALKNQKNKEASNLFEQVKGLLPEAKRYNDHKSAEVNQFVQTQLELLNQKLMQNHNDNIVLNTLKQALKNQDNESFFSDSSSDFNKAYLALSRSPSQFIVQLAQNAGNDSNSDFARALKNHLCQRADKDNVVVTIQDPKLREAITQALKPYKGVKFALDSKYTTHDTLEKEAVDENLANNKYNSFSNGLTADNSDNNEALRTKRNESKIRRRILARSDNVVISFLNKDGFEVSGDKGNILKLLKKEFSKNEISNMLPKDPKLLNSFDHNKDGRYSDEEIVEALITQRPNLFELDDPNSLKEDSSENSNNAESPIEI